MADQSTIEELKAFVAEASEMIEKIPLGGSNLSEKSFATVQLNKDVQAKFQALSSRVFVEYQQTWKEFFTASSHEAWYLASLLLSFWRNEVKQLIGQLPSFLRPLFFLENTTTTTQPPWKFMDIRQVLQLSHPNVEKLLSMKSLAEQAEDVKKVVKLLSVELLKVHLEVLGVILGKLQNSQKESTGAKVGIHSLPSQPTVAELQAAGVYGEVLPKAPGSVIAHMSYALHEGSVQSKGLWYLIQAYCDPEQSQEFFAKVSSQSWDEAKFVAGKAIAEIARRDSFASLALTLSNYKLRTDGGFAASMCFRIWETLSPHLSVSEQAFIMACICTEFGSARDYQMLFDTYNRARFPAEVFRNASSLPTLPHEKTFKLIYCSPEQIPAVYAEIMTSTKAAAPSVAKEAHPAPAKGNEQTHKGKNISNRSHMPRWERDARFQAPANYLPAGEHVSRYGFSPWSAMQAPNRGQHQQYAPQNRDARMPPTAPVNLINYSHERYMPQAPYPMEQCYDGYGQYGGVKHVLDENKRNIQMYLGVNRLQSNTDYDYYDMNSHFDATVQPIRQDMIPGGFPDKSHRSGQNMNIYTLYDDVPNNHIFINSIMRNEMAAQLLSKPMLVNGHEIRAMIDTGSAYSIIDPTLAADPKVGAQPTHKNVFLSSIGGPIEVPVVTILMKNTLGEDVEVRCAVTDLSKSSNDRLLIGYPDLHQLGYYVTVDSNKKIEFEDRVVEADDIMDPSAEFDEGLVKEENPEWDKHPFWQKYPHLLKLAKKLEDITPDKYITFPGSAMPIHTDNIEVGAYSNMRMVQGEIGVKIAQEIDKWMERGWVSPVTVSHKRIIYIPLLAVPKKNGDLRICLDFRRFNPAVQPLECAIPRILEFQEACSGKKYFTEIDLSEAFMQLLLDKDNYYQLGLRTMNGYYTLNRAPFGLYTVPAHFQATIERMIATVKGAKVYFDNVVIASETLEEHADTLRQVIDIFLRYNVRVNMAKLQLCKTEMKMLGMIVSGEGIRADPEKINKCLQMKKPQNATQMRSFIGAVNFLRIFYPHASALMSQLNAMINDKSKLIKWSPSTEQAYNTLRKALMYEITLFFPRPSDKLVMYVDASDEGVAGALGVMDGDKFRVWKLHSKNISKVKHWSPTTKELYALISSLNEFYPYIFGRHVTVYTDHQPLVNELRIREPNKQMARWFELIAGLQFRVEYVPGRNNVLADYLSRVQWESDKEAQESALAAANAISAQTFTPWKEWQREQRLRLNTEQRGVPINSIGMGTGALPQESVERASQLQQASPERRERAAEQQHALHVATMDMNLRKRLTINNAQILRDKALMRAYNAQIDSTNNTTDISGDGTPLILSDQQNRALFDREVLWTYANSAGETRIFRHGEDIEDGYALSSESECAWISLAHVVTAHGGNNNIMAKLSEWNIDFPDKINKIQAYLDACVYCMRGKAVKHQHLPQRNQLANQPFAKIAIDIAQLPFKDADGVSAMLVIVDVFTRYTWALPVKNMEDTTVARALVEWMWDHSTPVEIQSDQGTHFVNDVMRQVVDTMRIVYNVSVPYYPQSNGVVERAIGTIKTKLGVLVAQSDGKLPWSTYMKAATHAMNTAVKTYHGQIPFDLLFAIQAVPPVLASSLSLENNDMEEALQLRYEQLLQTVSCVRDDALQRINKTTARRNEAANKNRILKPLQVGDMVLAKVLSKDNVASIRWFGPYEIHEIDSMSNYVLKAPNGSMCLRRFPRSHIKKANMQVRDRKMVADKIVDARMAGGMLEYRVGFQGYNKDSDAWISAQVVKEKFPMLLARFEEAKQKLMMEVSLVEGQKLSEVLDEDDIAALDSSVSAPRLGVALAANENDDGVAAAATDAPLDSRFSRGEESNENNEESTYASFSQPPNVESRLTYYPSTTTPVQANPLPQTLQPAGIAWQQPAQEDDYDAELLELKTTFRDIERKRNAPTIHEVTIPLRNPAAEARSRYYARQYYGTGSSSRGYVRALRNTWNEDEY